MQNKIFMNIFSFWARSVLCDLDISCRPPVCHSCSVVHQGTTLRVTLHITFISQTNKPGSGTKRPLCRYSEPFFFGKQSSNGIKIIQKQVSKLSVSVWCTFLLMGLKYFFSKAFISVDFDKLCIWHVGKVSQHNDFTIKMYNKVLLSETIVQDSKCRRQGLM